MNEHDHDTTQTIFMSGPAGLARILDQNQKDTALWGPEEMRAMWRHQLRAPLDADLSTVQSANLAVLRLAPETSGFLDKSFENLLQNAKPSLSLLKISKQFAKETFKEAEDPQLKEIAAALYYACYAVGIVAHGQRLGGMSTRELTGGFEWAIGRIWLDEPTKKLIKQARELLTQ
jgi:hypothetical protein